MIGIEEKKPFYDSSTEFVSLVLGFSLLFYSLILSRVTEPYIVAAFYRLFPWLKRHKSEFYNIFNS